MAAGQDPIQELCKEASCSICLDFFRDPVTIPECGHNFCRDCLTQSWEESEAPPPYTCPQCRKARERDLLPNRQLANMVGIAKRLCPVEAKKGVCEKHREPQKFFCREEEALLCVVCGRSPEHKDHQVVPLEEAVQEKKDHFGSCLESLRKEKAKIQEYKTSLEKESEDLLGKIEEDKQKLGITFGQLHTFLEEQEELLLSQVEKVEKEVEEKRDQHLAKLNEEFYFLERLIWEMEQRCKQPADEFLKDARKTLQRYEKKKTFANPVAFPLGLKWRIWDVSDLNPLVEGIMKRFKGTLASGLHLQKANVILDQNTAHPELILSEGRTSVRCGKKAQALPAKPERFEEWEMVLGREGFTGGRHFWEVLVRSKEAWVTGVARQSVKRKGDITFSPEEGFWAVGASEGVFNAIVKGSPPRTLTRELKRIRVCLNYVGGRVTFFDADTAVLLYEFSGASFSRETLLPLFWVSEKGHLKISS